jgi:AcrR family transcriptional regulator
MTGKKAVTAPRPPRAQASLRSTRERVLSAAFAVFRRRGFAAASTLEIATRAQVSKRDLYALFASKHAMLTACIRERASRMRQPLELAAPLPISKAAVAVTLIELGTTILRVACHPDVLAVHRLAIAESDRAPEIARTLDRSGREANHAALGAWLARVQAQGFIGAGDPAVMAAHFLAVLWGGLLIQLLLRVRDAPTADEIELRARAAAKAVLTLYPPPLEIDVGNLRARAVEFTGTELVVTLADGRKIVTPLDWYPRLKQASAKQRANFEIMPMGIHWPDLDEDFGIVGMLKGQRP